MKGTTSVDLTAILWVAQITHPDIVPVTSTSTARQIVAEHWGQYSSVRARLDDIDYLNDDHHHPLFLVPLPPHVEAIVQHRAQRLTKRGRIARALLSSSLYISRQGMSTIKILQ